MATAYAAGAFGDWRTGLDRKWRADIGRALTPDEEAAQQERVRAIRAQREAEEAKAQEGAANLAAAHLARLQAGAEQSRVSDAQRH